MLRITNSLMASNMRNYIQNNLQRSAKSQEQMSTGKTILRPSDNPGEISHLMAVNGTLKHNEQYLDNIKDGLSHLNQSDAVLDSVGKYLQEAKVLANQANNEHLTQSDREAIEKQIDKSIDAIVDLANSSLGGKYLFAGTQNAYPPFVREGDKIYYRGNTDAVTREISFNAEYEVTTPGAGSNGMFGFLGTEEIYDDLTGTNIKEVVANGSPFPFAALFNFKDALKNGGDINQSLGELEEAHDFVLAKRTGVGARTRHLEAVEDQLGDQEVKLKGILVNIQGADVAKLTIEVAENLLVHQASLLTGSKLLEINLLQYLR